MAAGLGLAGCDSPPGDASGYPNRPLKVYVPFAAGGGSDTFARIIQKAISEHNLLPQPVAIVNLEGAGGTIGSRRVKDAKPDGYSILHLHEGIMTAHAMGRVSFGSESFVPIAATGENGLVLTVSSDSPHASLSDLLARAKAQPNTVAYAANLGAASHYAGLLLEHASPGATFRYVHYGGGEARFTAIKGGHIDVSLFSIEEYQRFRSIGLRALAFFGHERHPALPDVPSTYEQGVPVAFSNVDYWWAPLGTPADRISVLADALEAAMQTPQVRQRLAEIHSRPLFLRDAPLRTFIEQRRETIARVSPRQTTKPAVYPAVILSAIGVLSVVVIGQSWRSRRARPAVTASPPAVTGVRHRSDLAIVTLLLTAAYVGAMATERVGYRLATVAFIVALGLTLARPTRRVVIVTGVIALLMGPGLHFLLTRVFFVDLP
jgi:tripartite-type tricarboxylate transporter receptor subunit TctC